MGRQIEIYRTKDNQTQVEVRFEKDSVWLSLNQITDLFQRDKSVISRHIRNIFKEEELEKKATVAKNATVQNEGGREVVREIEFYNLDVIISVGYRIKSLRGTQFRQWATQRLKDYLVQGYAINEKRLQQKQQEVQYLKTGLRILSRTIEEKASELKKTELLNIFSQGLELLDDYDLKKLDDKGLSTKPAVYPGYEEYLSLIHTMEKEFDSAVFALSKDDSFKSSINQIKQSFDGEDIYASLEEKAAMLLYLIVKNHSFVDGNKRIAAACFLYFLEQNKILLNVKGEFIISNEALATLTLFVALSKSDEMKTIKQLIVSILNRNRNNDE